MKKEAPKIDWDMLMRFGLGALGLAPSEFWRMTPREFDAALKGRMGVFEDRSPMSRDAFAALSRDYPDGEAR